MLITDLCCTYILKGFIEIVIKNKTTLLNGKNDLVTPFCAAFLCLFQNSKITAPAQFF